MIDWKEAAEELRFVENKSWTQIANEMQHHFPGLDSQQILEKVRRYLRSCDQYKENAPEKQEIIGVIGDTHFPFAHPNYIRFLEDTFNKYRVTRIVHIGDLVDHHAISRFQTEVDAYSATNEFELAQKDVEIITRAFPKMDITLGNHCLIPERQCATLGIPTSYLKGYKELWNLPKGCNVHEQIIINNVLYEHGIGTSGKTGAIDKATNQMMSCVIGHSHAFGGAGYRSNAKTLIFGLNVGCGIDIDRYAFRYGRYNKNRETLGCGIVFSESNAIFVPMDRRYFRSK